ncbi:MAG TPA: lytic transglycosylase domain-containing protein [Armatimonadota bacterium]|nr:lytic transglycosylase domain-containing protein [Armatimonadota bacterium]
MKSALLACAAVLLVSAPARPAQSSEYPQADRYYQVRDQSVQVVTTFTADEVQMQPQRFAGKLLEVRGLINAVAGSDTQTTLLISTSEGVAPTMVSLPPGKGPTSWPFLDVGIGIRALCRVVVGESGTNGALELVVPVKEYEAARISDRRAKGASVATTGQAQRRAALDRRRRPGKALASRGVSASAYGQSRVRVPGGEVVDRYADAVRYFNRRINPGQARRIAETIIEYSVRYDLDARLVMAVIACESNFNQHAVSPVGAMGLGQLMPGTAGDLGVGNAYDIRQNLNGSTRLLRTHIRNFSSNGEPTEEAIKLALACYNAGAGAVRKYRGIPPYRETQNYVKKITRLYKQLKGEQG